MMFQIHELCRLCGQRKRKKLDLFTDQNDGQPNTLLNKISLCLSVQVSREDMLPKMICAECHRSVEQFNAFRVKCHKAEERLNKMLALMLPNKQPMATVIKQEHFESDFHENSNSIHLKLDSPKLNESNSFSNLKSVKNVKCEVEELDNETSWNVCNSSTGPDLIQIISEEIVSQHCSEDIKQPQIEVISENFSDDFKNINFYENNFICDVKVIPESLLREEEGEINLQCFQENFQIQEVQDPESFAKIEKPVTEVEEESFTLDHEEAKQKVNTTRKESRSGKAVKRKRATKASFRDEEIDEKYLTLEAGETCDIDLEEMDALIKKKQDPNAIFNCDKCNKTFKFYKCLKKHKHWHNSQPEIFICDFCKNENVKSFEFSSLKSLNNHIQRKHLMLNSNKHQCDFCLQTFPSQGQLNAHFKKVHDDSGADCQKCGKKFKNSTRLNSHLVVHKDERPYVCDQCGQSFKWSNALKVHIQWHKQEKNFLCSECGKKFTAKKNLIEHLNIHTGRRPYVCEYCKASFVQFSAYSKHLYLHNEGKKIYKCDKCDKSYSHAYMLKQHLVRHTNLRPHECSTCHRAFKSQSDLCCHIKIHQEKQYGCEVCGKKFALSKTLRDHMVRHTGVKHMCPVPGCDKSYTQRFSLTKHFCKQHPLLTIVKKKSGKKAQMSDRSATEKDDVDFIRYDFKMKDGEEEIFSFS